VSNFVSVEQVPGVINHVGNLKDRFTIETAAISNMFEHIALLIL
jgi:hypothetical protein